MSTETNERVEVARMPEGIHYAYWFQVFNSLSFSIVLGVPMLLFMKRLGASATILGIVNALGPLLNILQIPAARYVEQVGYRSFVLRGWSLRSVFIIAIAGIAFLPPQIDSTTKIVLTLCCLFFYNASRGFSVCGFLPWLTQLVPEQVRGRYISFDQMFSFVAIVSGSLLWAFYLRWADGVRAFGVLFLGSFAAAMASLVFLRRIPDVPVSESSRNAEPVPWLQIIKFQPFHRFLVFNMVLFVGWAGIGVFYVPMLRDQFAMTDTGFLLLQAVFGVVFIVSIFILGGLADKVGSLPMLNVSLAVQVLHMVGWGLIGAHIIPFTWWSLGFQQASWGVAFALFQLANTRLVMSIVPGLGRSHFFAIFSVAQNLVLGLCPVFWGILVDALKPWHAHWGLWHGNAFSLLYPVSALFVLFSYATLARIHEPQALSTEEFFHELFVKTPSRAWSRLLNRRSIS